LKKREIKAAMNKKHPCLIVIFLIIASFIAFGRIAGNDFINFDDLEYITKNHNIQSGFNFQSIKWAFTAAFMGNWHPLTLLSHMLDWSLFGANPAGHHLVSLLMHIGAVIFLFLFLNKTTGNLWPSAFAAALFALHPLRVESVAWAAERKDVLSMFFGMASFYAYAVYAENSKLSRYFICLILFALSLMSKPMLVTLPFVLLLLDYWPLKRWQKVMAAPVENHYYSAGPLIWEKVPFILLTVVSSILTFWAQNKSGSIVSMRDESFLLRIFNAINSYVSYLGKTFWPIDLAIFYHPAHSFPLWQILGSCFILIMITIVAIYAIKNMPFLFVGWFWYLGTLIPVIGLVQVGSQAMADRYTYMPSIGIAIIMAWGIPLLFTRADTHKKILFLAEVAALSILAILTWQQCGYWKNSAELFNHALQVTKDNDVAHNSLGMAMFEKGKMEDAIDHYNEAIRISPRYASAYSNRGVVYASLGQLERAIDDFNKAIVLRQNDANAYNNRGIIYLRLGNKELGCRNVQKACELGSCSALKFAAGRGLCR
jgi:tetratricopeptide (TPR) repeat protein